ncbi:hypothetical protein ACO2Q8_00025 [Larkinella sp. VNQ87]|uniref:hypothetical protein n=1 Tax=Larkinella sp. VNQ87 TaxID=3400921 RepID=UPI003C0FF618
MKIVTLATAGLLWISTQTYAQTPSPNTHAPEQTTQHFPEGDPTVKMDSLRSNLVKGTQSSRNARRTSEAAKASSDSNASTTVRKKTTKTVKSKKTDNSSDQ